MSLAVEKGAGLASLPDYMVADKPHLVRVLPTVEGPSYQTYFVYTEAFKNDRRLEVFRDFLFSEAKDWHCLLYTSPSPRDCLLSRMPSSA